MFSNIGGKIKGLYDYEQGQLKHCGINVSSGMTEFYYFFDVNPESGTMDFQKKH